MIVRLRKCRSIGTLLSQRLLTLLCLLVCSAICDVLLAEDAEEATANLYAGWVKQYEGSSNQPNERDPMFLELLVRPDGDLFFLRGLGAVQDPVRRLSRQALARLKTDRAFDTLAKHTKDKDMFVRERAVGALGDFRQDRCVPVLLEVLKTDREPQVRGDAAFALANFRGERVEGALLKALKDDIRVGYQAANALSRLQVAEAIEPTYQLLLATEDGPMQKIILGALRGHERKQVVRRLLDLQDKFSPKDETGNKFMLAAIQSAFREWASKTKKVTGPEPESPEQCREWWVIAEPLFSDDLQLLLMTEPAQPTADELGRDAEQLKFSIAVDAKTYRVGDPIGVNFSLQNKSDKPMRTIPPVTSGWRPTMAYGIHLTRLGDQDETLIAIKPSDDYAGSYSGPPDFQTLRAGQTFVRRDCLRSWAPWSKRARWPLTSGSYRLSIVFDNAQFAGVHPKWGEIVHRWEASPVEFVIDGAPRTDPKELLRLIAEKCELKWLDTDLDSTNPERWEPAWYALRVWGDDRLQPVLKDRERFSQWPLPPFDFDANP